MTIATDSHTYVEMLTTFPPRPIKSSIECDQVQAVIDQLLDEQQLSEEQRDYLNLLALLIEDYEAKTFAISDIYGVELLKVLIVDRGLKQKDLVPIFKTESIVSAVLSGQRNLTVEHIENLANFFHLSPAVFFKTSMNG
jgi:HTH-type transcriptional regulator / antitoxin HigA